MTRPGPLASNCPTIRVGFFRLSAGPWLPQAGHSSRSQNQAKSQPSSGPLCQ
jgi:hypothetical protein